MFCFVCFSFYKFFKVVNLVDICVIGRLESEFVEKIVKEIFRMLNDLFLCEISGFLGIELCLKELEELLMFDNVNCVCVIGVFGMIGIGKMIVVDSVYK